MLKIGNSTMESNPLAIDGNLFFISPMGRIICLDGASGHERWTFDASPNYGNHRGVSYWTDGSDKRILFTSGSNLYSVDADTGQLIESFGSHGRVQIDTTSSSPGTIYKDLFIIGGSASSIRAFDIHTGKLRWVFNTIPRPGEFGYDTWPRDAWKTAVGVNNWSGMTLDEKRGIVFVPLAYPADYYGANRKGDNLFANSLVALDARNGHRLWHFQVIRHDTMDRDLPAPPTLVTVLHDGRQIEAVAQATKHGFIYVLDRVTGRSLFPIVESRAVASDIPGVDLAATQPEPILPAPFARQYLTADMLTKRTPEAAAAAAEQFAKLRSGGLWEPISTQGTILFPGLDGGAEWGGAAFDPQTGYLYVNSNEMAWILTLKRTSVAEGTNGFTTYQRYCASCHGENRSGHPPEIPSLIGVTNRLSFYQIAKEISTGSGRMPAFPFLAADQARLWALDRFLSTEPNTAAEKAAAQNATGQEYIMDGTPRFVDQEGYPAIAPPWGTLNAIDLNTGRFVWRVPFGEYPELAEKGQIDTGTENYGGPIVTAGGLLFIGATSFDKKFRAYDKHTGRVLWQVVLPAAGNATPTTYRAQGRQFVVIPAGGGRPPSAASGSKIVAFALPH